MHPQCATPGPLASCPHAALCSLPLCRCRRALPPSAGSSWSPGGLLWPARRGPVWRWCRRQVRGSGGRLQAQPGCLGAAASRLWLSSVSAHSLFHPYVAVSGTACKRRHAARKGSLHAGLIDSRRRRTFSSAAATEESERLRLNNLSPQPGSKKNKNRKGRGYGAGQVRCSSAGHTPLRCSDCPLWTSVSPRIVAAHGPHA